MTAKYHLKDLVWFPYITEPKFKKYPFSVGDLPTTEFEIPVVYILEWVCIETKYLRINDTIQQQYVFEPKKTLIGNTEIPEKLTLDGTEQEFSTQQEAIDFTATLLKRRIKELYDWKKEVAEDFRKWGNALSINAARIEAIRDKILIEKKNPSNIVVL
jgi:hypothetical protein